MTADERGATGGTGRGGTGAGSTSSRTSISSVGAWATKAVWHMGQRTLRPKALSGNFNCLRHPVQETNIDMLHLVLAFEAPVPAVT